MIYSPIFQIIKAAPAVTALLGTSPVRFFPFGEAPQDVARPYAVWQQVAGYPENYLGQRPDMDLMTLQVDVFAETASAARSAAEALRNALELHCHITRWGGEDRDHDTNLYRFGFDADWHVSR